MLFSHAYMQMMSDAYMDEEARSSRWAAELGLVKAWRKVCHGE